jgi:Phosphotransferase enzyme family/Nitroreductase family
MNVSADSDAGLTEELVPLAPLRRWLSGRLPVADDLAVQRVSTGHSNEMFRLSTGSHEWLLRRPPRVRSAASAHDMAQEFRLLSALDDSDVPHARALALREDAAVIGAPFLVQSFVSGFPPTLPLPEPFTADVTARRELVFGLVEALESVPAIVLPCLIRYRSPRSAEGGSIYPACQNLLLAARALGYGGVMTGFQRLVEDELREVLGIPDNAFIAGTITLGRPVGRHGPVRRRPLRELVYADQWDQVPSWAVDPPGTAHTAAGPPAQEATS